MDDPPLDAPCKLCDPWEGGRDPWAPLEQQRKITRVQSTFLSPEDLDQLNKWLAQPISPTPASTLPKSTTTSIPQKPSIPQKSVFILASDHCDIVTNQDDCGDIEFEVVLDEGMNDEIMDWVEENVANDSEMVFEIVVVGSCE